MRKNVTGNGISQSVTIAGRQIRVCTVVANAVDVEPGNHFFFHFRQVFANRSGEFKIALIDKIMPERCVDKNAERLMVFFQLCLKVSQVNVFLKVEDDELFASKSSLIEID